MLASLLRTNSARHAPLSAATLQKIRDVLRTALNGAIRRGLIDANPARWVELPSGRRPKAVVWTDARVTHWQATGERLRVAVWTPAQTAVFLRHHRYHPLYPLPAGHVAGSAAWGSGRSAVVRPRPGRSGVDGVPPGPGPQRAHRDLSAQDQPQCSYRCPGPCLRGGPALLACCPAQELPGPVEPTGYLFANRHGAPLSPGYLTHTFRRLAEEAGLPPIRLHDLRHGAASLSLAAGNDLKTVQDLLGHDSIVLTADTYTSVMPCLAHRAAEATANLVLQTSQRRSRGVRSGRRRHQRLDNRRDRRASGHLGTKGRPTA
jgi:hypothetical protein